MTGLPAAITPAASMFAGGVSFLSSSVARIGRVLIGSGGTVACNLYSVSGSNVDIGNFVNDSLTKGFQAGNVLVYPL